MKTGHVNGVNVIGLTLQGPSVPLAAIRPPAAQQGISISFSFYIINFT